MNQEIHFISRYKTKLSFSLLKSSKKIQIELDINHFLQKNPIVKQEKYEISKIEEKKRYIYKIELMDQHQK